MSECIGRIGNGDCEVACQPWTTKMPKAAQPNLNYIGKYNNYINFITKLIFSF